MGAHAPLQGGKLEALRAELDEGSQVCLADPAYGVDVCAGAVVLGQVAEEAAAGEKRAVSMQQTRGAADSTTLGAWPSEDSLLPGPWGQSLADSRVLEKPDVLGQIGEGAEATDSQGGGSSKPDETSGPGSSLGTDQQPPASGPSGREGWGQQSAELRDGGPREGGAGPQAWTLSPQKQGRLPTARHLLRWAEWPPNAHILIPGTCTHTHTG